MSTFAPNGASGADDRSPDSSPEPPEREVRVKVLGPVLIEGRTGGGLVEPPGARGKALVVALALAAAMKPGRSLSVASLVDELWGDTPPRSAKPALQTLVSRLRQISADDLIDSTPGGYALSGRSDLGIAARGLRDARDAAASGDHSAVERAVSGSLLLWHGEPGSDLGDSELASELFRQSDGLRAELVTIRAASRLASGDVDGSLADLDSLHLDSLHLDSRGLGGPLVDSRRASDESLLALRMRVLAAGGRRNDALRAFAEFRERLADELGTMPSNELVALNAELLRDDGSTEPSRSRTSTPAAADPHSTDPHSTDHHSTDHHRGCIAVGLRTAPNDLIGREGDIQAVEAQLHVSRLVTILGTGGLGKTRLAQEVGRRATGRFPAVYVVELAGVRSGEDLSLALATVLGIREATVGRLTLSDPGVRRDLRDTVLGRLSERPTLLIVDNCEHLVDAAAQWVADILASTTAVRVVATSRAPLAIGAERVYPLDSLASSSGVLAEGPAERLFRERARAARPGVALPSVVVQRLCSRLDGLPLALELAAARVRSMPVEEIERRLGNRFALLTSGDRSAPERHRTLTAVIDWSWNLLTSSEQALLRRLSRFPGGFDADAAQVVGSLEGSDGVPTAIDVADDLEGLVNQSLVSVADDAATGRTRYRMLETVREFGDLALREAGEEQAVRESMVRWAESYSTRAMVELDGRDQIRAFAEMAVEQDNLVAILRAALDRGDSDTAMVLFAALGYYWSMRGGHSDVGAFGSRVISATRGYIPKPEHRDLAIIGYTLGGSLAILGDTRSGLVSIGRLRILKRQRAADDPFVDALSDMLIACVTDRETLLRTLAEAGRSTDLRIASVASLVAAQVRENDGFVDEALELATRAHRLAVEGGRAWTEATSAAQLAEIYTQLNEPEEVIHWAGIGVAGLSALQATTDVRHLTWLGALANLSLGRTDSARETLESILDDDDQSIALDYDDLRLICLAGLAEVDLAEGRTEKGLALYERTIETMSGRSSVDGLPVPISPWLSLVSASSLAAQTLSESPDPQRAALLANRVRTRLLATMRVENAFTDIPILGGQVFGLAAWLLWPSRPSTETHRSKGLELFFLAGGMQGRQDLPSLQRKRLDDVVAGWPDHGAVDRARAAAAGLSPFESRDRALVLLADRSLRPSACTTGR